MDRRRQINVSKQPSCWGLDIRLFYGIRDGESWGNKAKRPFNSYKYLLEWQASGRGKCSFLSSCNLQVDRAVNKGTVLPQSGRGAGFPEAGLYVCCNNKSGQKQGLQSLKQIQCRVKINPSWIQEEARGHIPPTAPKQTLTSLEAHSSHTPVLNITSSVEKSAARIPPVLSHHVSSAIE